MSLKLRCPTDTAMYTGQTERPFSTTFKECYEEFRINSRQSKSAENIFDQTICFNGQYYVRQIKGSVTKVHGYH